MSVAFLLYGRKNDLLSLGRILVFVALVFAAFLFEFYLGRVTFLISDGFKYYANPEDWIVAIDRALWGYINYFEKYIDLGGDFFIKIINVPILAIFLYYLRSTYKKIDSPFWFVLVCPSIAYLAISNLRDVLIWAMALLVIRSFFLKKTWGFFLFFSFCILLYMLRPFMLATALIAIFLFDVVFVKKNKMSGGRLLFAKRVMVLLFFTVSSIVVYPVIKTKLDSYVYNGTWLLESGYANIAKDKGVDDLIDSSNLPMALGFAAVRYLMTPQPDSILKRWFDPSIPANPYGFTSEFLRFFNQLMSYAMLIYLTLNFRTVFRVFSAMKAEQQAFLVWCFFFWPIYAFVHFGGSHQRLKTPFQLLQFILFIYVYFAKREKRQFMLT